MPAVKRGKELSPNDAEEAAKWERASEERADLVMAFRLSEFGGIWHFQRK